LASGAPLSAIVLCVQLPPLSNQEQKEKQPRATDDRKENPFFTDREEKTHRQRQRQTEEESLVLFSLQMELSERPKEKRGEKR
jgi:hypothetical protein